MGDFISKIFSFFTDTNRSVRSKSIYFLFIILFVWGADYITGLSYYMTVYYKVSQLERIENLKKSYPDNKTLVVELDKMEYEILNRKTIKDYYSFFELPEKISSKPDTTIQNNTTINTNSSNNIRSNFWHVVSSTYIFLFSLIGVVIMPFTGIAWDIKTVVGYLLAIALLMFLIWLFSYLFSLIPILGYSWVNYLLNAFIHTLFIYLIAKTGSKNK